MREKTKAFFKNKLGMTYVELLVALSLLCLIMVAFTPMLLKSYETLYGAGELNEATYEGKQEIEEGLATRVENKVTGLNVSLSTKTDLSENLSSLISNFEVGLRNITSSTQFSLQTLFFGGRGRLNVLSSSIMRDDYDAKEIVVQAEGVNLTDIKKAHGSTLNKDDVGSAAIRVYLPQYDSNKTSEAEGFNESKYVPDHRLTVTKLIEGDRYKLTVTGVDITTPVLKIVLWYIDENNKKQELSTVVKIEPATITIVGDTLGAADSASSIAYYTTAGVEVEKTATGYNESFKVESRKMTGGSYPTGTSFLNIQWVDNDAATDLDPYYVITGSNGTIQRLFISNADPKTYRGISGRSDVVGFPYTVDGLTKYTFATVWGGDKSHQFAFSTAVGDDDELHQAAYSRGSWLTSDGMDGNFPNYKGQAGVYGVQAKMAFYFNGFRFRTGGDERMRDGRRISYVILESGYPLRFIGARKHNNSSASWGGFITPWEGPDKGGNGTEFHWGEDWGLFSGYGEYTFNASSPKVLLWNRSDDNALNYDEALAYLNLKAYSNISAQKVMIAGESELGADGSVTNYLSDANSTNIKITASYYNPVSNEMRYLGTSVAYGYVQQTDNTGILIEQKSQKNERSNAAEKYQYVGSSIDKHLIPLGSITGYLIAGSDFGGTTIYKYSTARSEAEYQIAAPALNKYATASYASTYTGQSAEFYVARRANTYTKTVDTDLEFTLGYSSNREEVFANVTYGTDKTEYQASYERFFNHSHYTLSNPSDYIGSLGLFEAFTTGEAYRNTIYGSHYHVWFPGEFYNLTHTVTKDGVTVAVGYTVSGSSYQWVDPSLSGNTSTALGSVYNDGVLAAMVNTGNETDGQFKNLLYYKDYETCATNNIISDKNGQINNYGSFSNYVNSYPSGNYGTHARQSIRFQAVDIATLESQAADGTYAKHYMAFFGDNRGRLFYAHVGSAVGTGVNSETGEVTGANIALVRGIKDLGVEPFGDDGGAGYAQQLEVDIGDHFSEITSIFCQDNVVIVCGTERDGSGVGVMLGRFRDDAGVDRFEYFEIESTGNYVINDALVLNGYLYLVGQKNNSKGFVMAAQYSHIEAYITMSDAERAADVAGINSSGELTEGANNIPDAWENANNAIKKSLECGLSTVAYSIAGHA